MRLLIAIIFIIKIGSIDSYAHAKENIIPKAWKNGIHKKVRIKEHTNIKYPLVHLNRPGAIPVILLHGFGGNVHNWMDLGSALYNEGYDVWGFTWTINKERNIDAAGAKTVKEIAKYVFKRTGQKSFIIGHSLGGMVARIYALGLIKGSDGKYIISKEAQRDNARYVKGSVVISSPNGIFTEDISSYLKIFDNMPNSYLPGSVDLSHVINAGVAETDTLWVKLLNLNLYVLRIPFVSDFITFVFNMKMHDFDDYSLAKLARYGYQPVPVSYKDDLQRMSDQIGSSSGDIVYADVFLKEKRPFPFAYITGSEDPLAPTESLIQEARAHGETFLSLRQAGHIDPLFGKMGNQSVRFILNFLKEQK